jgi:metal-sulfur cluster biosynthetic enzyme
MAEELENSNPTILLASDLPSRTQQQGDILLKHRRSDGGTGLFDASASVPSFLYTPFESTSPHSSDVEMSEGDDDDAEVREEIDAQEIYGSSSQATRTKPNKPDLISPISDPEHPLSLGSLAVVNLPDIHITPLLEGTSSPLKRLTVELTPTVNHCSLATVIGLGVRVRLEQSLSPRYRINVRIKEGTHSTAEQVNKQLGDKERVAAAMENANLVSVIRRMLTTCG